MKARTNSSFTEQYGFTLIELLGVMAIFVTLVAVITPAITSAVRSSRINMATQFVIDEINAARAAAIAQNKPMEFCFLRGTTGTEGLFEQMAVRSVSQDGTKGWIHKSRKLPDGIAISANATLSTVIGSQTEQTNLRGEKEVCLLFTPSGEMSLTALSGTEPTEYYLTLASSSDLLKTPDAFPANFATIRIDPRNSQTTLHRP
jgi:uncharacterized protein (TIGR02596 family)